MLKKLADFFKMPAGYTKKQKLLRGLLGIPIGISISLIISVIISVYLDAAGEGGGLYYPCAPELVAAAGSEINAVIIQLLLSAALGFVMGAASVIWQFENWSIVKQTGVFFIIIAVIMLAVGYLLYWMEHSLQGFIRYLLSFIIYFIIVWVVIWLTEYFSAKRKVKNFNMKIKEEKDKRKE